MKAPGLTWAMTAHPLPLAVGPFLLSCSFAAVVVSFCVLSYLLNFCLSFTVSPPPPPSPHLPASSISCCLSPLLRYYQRWRRHRFIASFDLPTSVLMLPPFLLLPRSVTPSQIQPSFFTITAITPCHRAMDCNY